MRLTRSASGSRVGRSDSSPLEGNEAPRALRIKTPLSEEDVQFTLGSSLNNHNNTSSTIPSRRNSTSSQLAQLHPYDLESRTTTPGSIDTESSANSKESDYTQLSEAFGHVSLGPQQMRYVQAPPSSSTISMSGHKRELSSSSYSSQIGLPTVSEFEFGNQCQNGVLSTSTSSSGSTEEGSKKFVPSGKRSNGGVTPAGIRFLKDGCGSIFNYDDAFRPQHPLPRPLHPARPSTLIIYPPYCLEHLAAGHQENSDRLLVLCGPHGVLHRPQFENLKWAQGEVKPAVIADILRVHDYEYVKHLQSLCDAVPSSVGRGTGGGRGEAVVGEDGTYDNREASATMMDAEKAQQESKGGQPEGEATKDDEMVLARDASPPPLVSSSIDSNSAYNTGSQSSHPSQNPSIRDFPVNAGRCDSQPSASAFLDTDTRISRESFRVASVAAGAVIQAVDAVAQCPSQYIFVASRPPGHHAGPRGAVPSICFWKVPSMCSSGFCLLNNVAIGAAYARYTYGREEGPFRRIAIIDFDCHHGNGTEEIVRCLRPQKRTLPLPASWAPVEYKLYKPWLSEDDADNVFFGSINLVDGVHFYPCSGRTADDDYVNYPNIVNVELTPIKVQPPTGPGRSRPSAQATAKKNKENCQKASAEFREKVSQQLLPRLRSFDADLLFISAGFDGHCDDLYHWLTDEDYAWITRELRMIMEMNQGSIISVLEGGYHLKQQPKAIVRNPVRAVKKAMPSLAQQMSKGGGVGSLVDESGIASSDDEATLTAPLPPQLSSGGSAGSPSAAVPAVSSAAPHIDPMDGGLPRGVMAHILALLNENPAT